MSALVWQAVRFVAAFALVLAAAAWATRWMAAQARGMQRPALSLLGGVALGGSRQVCAVRVGRRVLIRGLADKQVSLLGTITDPEEIALLVPPRPQAAQGSEFAALLRRAVRRRPPGGGSHGG